MRPGAVQVWCRSSKAFILARMRPGLTTIMTRSSTDLHLGPSEAGSGSGCGLERREQGGQGGQEGNQYLQNTPLLGKKDE